MLEGDKHRLVGNFRVGEDIAARRFDPLAEFPTAGRRELHAYRIGGAAASVKNCTVACCTQCYPGRFFRVRRTTWLYDWPINPGENQLRFTSGVLHSSQCDPRVRPRFGA